MDQVNAELGSEEETKLYAVNCIHCDKHVFRFSQSLLIDCGKVDLVCPSCGQCTEVDGNGRISCG